MTTYKQAGVDKEEGYKTVSKIKEAVASTHNLNVLKGIGSFGAFYELEAYKNPVLVSGTDGVGTKLRIALDVKKYDTVGVDCVAMCANDILCHGAKPLFFLDYLACGKLDSDVAAEIIKGIVTACKETSMALIGGETAEMPGIYKVGDYDIAGFCVGVVEKEAIIDGSKIKEGDVILGLPASGFHSNGFSLIRKIFTDMYEEFEGKPLFEELLKPTRLYQQTVFNILEKYPINGIAHITGGGLVENVPRIVPEGLCAAINKKNIQIPEVFKLLQERGKIAETELFGTFNMGVGMVLVVNKELATDIATCCNEPVMVLGEIRKGANKIELT